MTCSHLPGVTCSCLACFFSGAVRTLARSLSSELTNTLITHSNPKSQTALITAPPHTWCFIQRPLLMTEVDAWDQSVLLLFSFNKSLYLKHCFESNASAYTQICLCCDRHVFVLGILLPFCYEMASAGMQIAMETVKDCYVHNSKWKQKSKLIAALTCDFQSRNIIIILSLPPAQQNSSTRCCLCICVSVRFMWCAEMRRVHTVISLSVATLFSYSLVWAEQMWLSVSR